MRFFLTGAALAAGLVAYQAPNVFPRIAGLSPNQNYDIAADNSKMPHGLKFGTPGGTVYQSYDTDPYDLLRRLEDPQTRPVEGEMGGSFLQMRNRSGDNAPNPQQAADDSCFKMFAGVGFLLGCAHAAYPIHKPSVIRDAVVGVELESCDALDDFWRVPGEAMREIGFQHTCWDFGNKNLFFSIFDFFIRFF